MCREYEMLSTGLFTKARICSQGARCEKVNNDGVFARFWRSAANAKIHAPEAVVDKFFSRRGQKTAGREKIRYDKKRPEDHAAGADVAAGEVAAAAGFFFTAAFLRLM